MFRGRKSRKARKARKVAYLFPGQGSQGVGMGKDLYNTFPQARAVFDQADQVLGFPLSQLCFKGPEEELRRTVNTQPAVLTVSIACLAAAREVGIEGRIGLPCFVAGHSLGEYTSLVAANVADFPQVLRLVQERGRLMEEASAREPGGMLAVLGLDIAQVEEVCQQSGAQIANINCPGQVILSGSPAALEKALQLVQEGGGKARPLEVSGAFHSSLMRRAMRKLVKSLVRLRWHRPEVPIVANTTAQPLTSLREVKRELGTQLCHCVQWQGSVEFMAQRGVSTFVELGPGQVLSGLVRRISPEAEVLTLRDVPSIEALSPPC